MILRREDLQLNCSILLQALDSNTLSPITETLELITTNGVLNMNITNKEYYVKVKINVGTDENLHATVNANLFLNLISKVTTDTIELKVSDSTLIVKGNGTYKIPLIFEGETLLSLPEIVINNKTNEFPIASNILHSILQFNSKQLTMGTISKPVQKLYYVDDKGALTFTSGACVNSFMLSQPIRILLNDRLVKLFKLFKNGDVNFTLGYDEISDGIIQTKVKFECNDITITAILSCDDSLLNSVPEQAIRNRANAEYPYSVTVNKESLIQTINRLLLFGGKDVVNLYSTFKFHKDSVTIYDVREDNKEELYYNNSTSNVENEYTAILDFADLKAILETCVEQYVNIHFGNNVAMVLSRGNVKNVIPEVSRV